MHGEPARLKPKGPPDSLRQAQERAVLSGGSPALPLAHDPPLLLASDLLRRPYASSWYTKWLARPATAVHSSMKAPSARPQVVSVICFSPIGQPTANREG